MGGQVPSTERMPESPKGPLHLEVGGEKVLLRGLGGRHGGRHRQRQERVLALALASMQFGRRRGRLRTTLGRAAEGRIASRPSVSRAEAQRTCGLSLLALPDVGGGRWRWPGGLGLRLLGSPNAGLLMAPPTGGKALVAADAGRPRSGGSEPARGGEGLRMEGGLAGPPASGAWVRAGDVVVAAAGRPPRGGEPACCCGVGSASASQSARGMRASWPSRAPLGFAPPMGKVKPWSAAECSSCALRRAIQVATRLGRRAPCRKRAAAEHHSALAGVANQRSPPPVLALAGHVWRRSMHPQRARAALAGAPRATTARRPRRGRRGVVVRRVVEASAVAAAAAGPGEGRRRQGKRRRVAVGGGGPATALQSSGRRPACVRVARRQRTR